MQIKAKKNKANVRSVGVYDEVRHSSQRRGRIDLHFMGCQNLPQRMIGQNAK